MLLILLCYIILFNALVLTAAAAASAGSPKPWNFNSGVEMVWHGNDLIYERFVGKKNYESSEDFEYDTQVRIDSNTKLFTAVAILQLIEAGKIKSVYSNINDYLDATDMAAWGLGSGVNNFCPTVHGETHTICENGQNMTFASLMSMQSGMVSPTGCLAPNGGASWIQPYCVSSQLDLTMYQGSIAATVSLFAKAPLWTAPNTDYDLINGVNAYFYANENFILLSYMIEKISGTSLRKYYQRNIFDVMGMTNTFYDPLSQALLLKPNMAGEYLFYTDLPFGPEYSANLEVDVPPFAVGKCDSIEANQGVENGAGGIVSTLPDMALWYASLFISKNVTTLSPKPLLSASSLEMIWFPWAAQNQANYYGFATETMYDSVFTVGHLPYATPPAMGAAAYPDSIFYMGGSECSFITLLAQFGSTNVFTQEPLVNVPMLTIVDRNNRILNVSQNVWEAAQNANTGTFYELSQKPYDWNAPACCENYISGSSLTDTQFVAYALSYYWAAQSSLAIVSASPTSMPTSSPVAAAGCTQSTANADTIKMQATIAAIVLAVFLFISLILNLRLYYVHVLNAPSKAMSSAGDPAFQMSHADAIPKRGSNI